MTLFFYQKFVQKRHKFPNRRTEFEIRFAIPQLDASE